MFPKPLSYEAMLLKVQVGDVIAFGGSSHISKMIKHATDSVVSHVGVIVQTPTIDTDGNTVLKYIEATSVDDIDKVIVTDLSKKLHTFPGEVWWLPLQKSVRQQHFKEKDFLTFLSDQENKPYDVSQALMSAIDLVDDLPFNQKGPTYNQENFDAHFCSELVAAGLEVAGVTGDINASEATPIDVCSWNIFENNYYQIQGTHKKIETFNQHFPHET